MKTRAYVDFQGTDHTERQKNAEIAAQAIGMVAELIDTPGWHETGLTIAGTIRGDGKGGFAIEFASVNGLPENDPSIVL